MGKECANCGNERIMLCPFCEHDFSENSRAKDAALAERDAEIERARETNTRLNRRVQAAEKAVADAQACIDKLSNGKTWCGGNLGRALLAFQNDKRKRELTRLRAVADAARKFVAPLRGTGIEFENKEADAAFVDLLDALDTKGADE